MKTIFLALLLMSSAPAADLAPDKIIPRFYELLMQAEKPSEQDESEFFGGAECENVAKTILLKAGYSETKTPVWDFLRNRKGFFITKGVADLGKARIHYSEPFHTSRLWNGTTAEDRKVHTMFPTERAANGASSGVSTVIFTLGESCHIDIGNTFISGTVQLFTDQVYKLPDSNGTDKK